MNTSRDVSPANDERLIDMLVDGELSDPQRRELLTRLGTEPDGWRRCAWAFLEAQSWQAGMASLAREASVQRTEALAPRESRPRPRRSLASLVTVAAGVLIAFSLGVALGGAWRSTEHSAPADGLLAETPPGADTEGVVPEIPRRADGEQDAQEEGLGRGGASLVSKDASPPPVRVAMLTLTGGEGSDGFQFQVPVLEGPGIDEQWLQHQPPAMPEYVQRQLERRGYQVAQRRRLLPFELEDGRRLVIPVDEVEVRYVGHRAF